MGSFKKPVERPLVELATIRDDFAQDVDIEDHADHVRLSFWSENNGERVVSVKVICTKLAYAKMLRRLSSRLPLTSFG